MYAHSKKELRKKLGSEHTEKAVNASAEGGSGRLEGSSRRLRTISETAATGNSEWETVSRRSGSRRVRTVSNASTRSCDSLPCDLGSDSQFDLEEFDWAAWSSQREVPQQEELDGQWDCVSYSRFSHKLLSCSTIDTWALLESRLNLKYYARNLPAILIFC